MHEYYFVKLEKAKDAYDVMDIVDITLFSKLAGHINKQIVRIMKVETLSE